jgi:glycosyltransferase involved in cell wall biosynthesis
VNNAAEQSLPAFDIFFQPSLWEAMSIVILEAMAAGKAIVATSVGETPHIIENEVDGLLVAPKDIKGMTLALSRLIYDAEFRRRMGNEAARKVAQHFTAERMTRDYEKIYFEIIR